MTTSAAKHQRVTLARVAVGDKLMTALDADGSVVPCRFSDGTVRTVLDIGRRKARTHEMPGVLITLVFADGTRTAERYGTTGHYYAAIFPGGVR